MTDCSAFQPEVFALVVAGFVLGGVVVGSVMWLRRQLEGE